MNAAAIPLELRERPQWVTWRREQRDGKTTKVPYRADGNGKASSTDPATWATFEQADAAASAFDGIGYVLTLDDRLVGLDLDGVLHDGRLNGADLDGTPLGAWVAAFNTYTEISPSGTGLRIIGRGSFPAGMEQNGRKRGSFEAYRANRFLTITGVVFEGLGELRDVPQDMVDAFFAAAFPSRASTTVEVAPQPVDLDDQELLDRMFRSRHGADLEALYRGDWQVRYSSQSEADLALVGALTWWTNRDPGRVDRMFRSSGLMREKWLRDDYREATISKAIADCQGGYEPAPRLRPATSPRLRPQVTSLLAPTPSGGGEVDHFAPDLAPTPSESPHSWQPVDIVARGARPPAPPEIIGLLYPGYNHLVSGEPEALKTWLVLAAAADELAAGRGVLWVDADDVGEGALLERLRLLGADDDAIGARFAYVLPDEPLDDGRRADVLDVVRARSCRLAVFDGFNPLLTLHGLNPDSGPDVENMYRLLAPIRKAPTAVVLCDNVVKSREAQGKWAIGSERKKSKAEVHLGMKSLAPLVRGGTGRAKIEVNKDRPGHLQRPSPGVLVIESTEDRCSWEIRPDDSRGDEGEFRPTELMEKVSRWLELQHEPRSRNQIEEMKLGKREYVRVAIDRLIVEGYATEVEGARRARLVQLERAFRKDDEGESS